MKRQKNQFCAAPAFSLVILGIFSLLTAHTTLRSSASLRSTRGALLLAVAASNGATLAQYRLEAPPVFDGMAAVANRLYMTLENGNIVCMEGKSQ